jgi:hypothetical protein
MLFVGGQAGVDYAPSWYNITRVNIDGTGIIKADLSNTTNGNRIWKILSDGLNVYALGDNANSGVGGALANIWKLDSSLNLVASAYLENAVSMFFDANGDIVVMQNSNNISGETAQYNVYNTSLVLQNSYFVQGPGVNNPVISLNSYVPDSGFVFSGSSSENEQSRTVAYPQDWAHIEGQTVQILGDGEYLDDQTYTISSGQVSPAIATSNNHIGLQITSKLQPMKIDGEVNVKKISALIADVYESVGGEYGSALDDMYTMELRTTGDPMDRDAALHSGYVELPFKGLYDRSGDIWITQDIPLPMTLRGLGIRLSKEEVS